MITGYGKLNGVRYFGLFLVNMGASASVPGVLAYVGLSRLVKYEPHSRFFMLERE